MHSFQNNLDTRILKEKDYFVTKAPCISSGNSNAGLDVMSIIVLLPTLEPKSNTPLVTFH
jgi:hypothetical protein